MIGKVYCTVCSETEPMAEVQSPHFSILSNMIESLLVACHATKPHCNHPLKFVIEEQPPTPESVKKRLVIRCKNHQCQNQGNKELITEVPIELVGCMTLVFHTSHEGHPLHVEWDGESWDSP